MTKTYEACVTHTHTQARKHAREHTNYSIDILMAHLSLAEHCATPNAELLPPT